MKNYFSLNIIKIILLSVIAALLFNTFNENGISVIGEEKTYAAYQSGSGSDEVLPPRQVMLNQAFELYETGDALMIDARDNWDYSDGHIENAINIPEFSFNPQDEKVSSLDKEKTYIIYCGSDDCDISKRLADQLYKLGFSSILFFEEGYEGWMNSGYPVSNGEENVE